MSHTENILKMLPDRINQRNDLMITPPWIAKDMINLLPEDVWNKDTTFLDPACKSGIFLHEIYLKLMETPAMIQEFPDKAERREHILQNQLYGIALNPMCQLTSARTVYGTIQGENNIILIDNYINIIKNKDTKFFKEAIKEQFGEMKFDVVIGNPPYQESTGTRAVAIFDDFIKLGMENGKNSCMITPARWLTDSKYEKFRKEYIHRVKELRIYKECKNVFSEINCGAISYYIADDDDNKQKVHDIKVKLIDDSLETYISSDVDFIPIDKYAISILNKCNIRTNKSSFKFLGRRIFGKSPRWSDGAPLLNLDNNGDMNFITYERAMFITNRCNSLDIKNKEYADYYRLITGSILNMSQSVVGEIGVTVPNTASDFNIVTLYYSRDKNECYTCSKYIKTKFARYLILITLSKSQTSLSEDRLKYIPYQDFSEHSDIDWSQSISNIDQQLYKKYNLTEEEIAYIEKTIKPMQ